MPLGLLAKDSIQDLEALAREAEKGDPSEPVVDGDIPTFDQDIDQDDSNGNLVEKIKAASASSDPETTSLTSPPETSAYEGFNVSSSSDYPEYKDLTSRYGGYGSLPGIGEKTESTNFFCCLFPWLVKRRLAPGTPGSQHGHNTGQHSSSSLKSDEDDMSSASDMLGEKLSEKDRQVVLARLGLAQYDDPSSSAMGSASNITPGRPKGLLNGIHIEQENGIDPLSPLKSSGIKGILKTAKVHEPREETRSDSNASNDESSVRRRSLFPTAVYEKLPRSSNKNATFSPMARVVTVKSKNDMSDAEKSEIWWQRHDYEDFRRCGRIITRAMLEGGSEIWLAGNQTSKRDSRSSDSKSESGDLVSTQGDKWWHTFGHSRRGLEHVVSVDEGRERQANVRNAIRAVLEEQNMQRVYKRVDPEKLKSVAHQNTAWARDLALASGSSDADAVKANFAEDRKSREFYLLKMNRTSTDRALPGFMVPRQRITTKKIHLDGHTSKQIRYRRMQEEKKEVSEPLHDPDLDERSTAMAKRAAGFSSDGDEKVNMAAVLSGLGAVSKKPASVAV